MSQNKAIIGGRSEAQLEGPLVCWSAEFFSGNCPVVAIGRVVLRCEVVVLANEGLHREPFVSAAVRS